MNRRMDDPAAEPKGKWLITFNDMITLLLTFFVLMISMSMIEETKTTGVADSVKKVLGNESSSLRARREVAETIVPSLQDKDIERARQERKNGESVDPFAAEKIIIAGMLERLEGAKTVPTKNGFSLSLNENFLFPSGSAEISGKGMETLQNIGKILQRADVSVRVEGHTDSTPIDSDKYPSNWELSLARAARVVRWLAERGRIAPERLSAAGYAATRPRAPNDSEQNRQVNRRVDIVLTFQKL